MSILRQVFRIAQTQLVRTVENPLSMQTQSISTTPCLENIRKRLPRPSEVKRVTKLGWKTRMSTVSGREIIMRRILKGRHVLTH